ncbi:hypothetical protein [Amycolatopsis sp. cmx-8-4]|uniref:hypothetical protein n=1 Tax=Amycolatopsis sp. cmx-8-4 TaxID=2790947 RepID=UPI00397DEEA9
MSNELVHYLRDVADALGDRWHATTAHCVGEDAALVGPEGGWVGVTVRSAPRGERLVLETWLSRDLSPHQPAGMVRPDVTVARNRPAAEVASDLRRRLIPKVIELIDAARDLAERRRRDAADLSSVLDAIGTRFGAQHRPGAHTVSVGAYGQPLFATAQVLQPLWRDGQHRVRFSIDASPDHALALAELVGDRMASLTTDVAEREAAG